VAKSPFFPFAIITLAVWVVGTIVFIYFWSAITCNGYKRAILLHGLGGGPIPVNTLYAAANLSSPSAPGSSLMATGANELLYFGGWLDLSKGPLVLHVPDFSGRYYSIQFTDPTDGANFANVGKRTTGTQAGDFLISAPGWAGTVAQGLKQISSPHHSVLVIGRALVLSDKDVEAAYALTQQVQVAPLS
jgi:hypothetical protein